MALDFQPRIGEAGGVKLSDRRHSPLRSVASRMRQANEFRHSRACGRLVIVVDNQFARAGARRLIDGASDLEVVGEAASGQAALDVCERLRPDLVLMDLQLGDMDGLAATR